jgi:hypothetical protein
MKAKRFSQKDTFASKGMCVYFCPQKGELIRVELEVFEGFDREQKKSRKEMLLPAI